VIHETFRRFSRGVSHAVGSAYTFVIAMTLVIIWAVLGPTFHYSDTWQLTINTGTTIVTFLVVFLIQNTQNRDAKALHLKLDELIHAIGKAHNRLIDCEDLSDEELHRLELEFRRIRETPEHARRHPRTPTHAPAKLPPSR
jgi:low affinity Fe/Cu permease